MLSTQYMLVEVTQIYYYFGVTSGWVIVTHWCKSTLTPWTFTEWTFSRCAPLGQVRSAQDHGSQHFQSEAYLIKEPIKKAAFHPQTPQGHGMQSEVFPFPTIVCVSSSPVLCLPTLKFITLTHILSFLLIEFPVCPQDCKLRGGGKCVPIPLSGLSL